MTFRGEKLNEYMRNYRRRRGALSREEHYKITQLARKCKKGDITIAQFAEEVELLFL